MITGVSVPGIDVPDSRGRTGLDRVGRDLTGNPDVVVTDVELLAAAWHVLRRTTLQRRGSDGRWVTEQRETYDRGNGATLLPTTSSGGRCCSPASSAIPSTST